jgi:hypothetical protein
MKMKIPSSIKNLLENKYVLYIVFFLAVTNLFGYMVMGNYKAIAMFVLVGYLVYVLNKNMIVVLLVPLILTSLFTSGFIREGAVGSMDASGNPIPPPMDASGNPIPPPKDANGNPIPPPKDANGNPIPPQMDANGNPMPPPSGNGVTVDASTGAATTTATADSTVPAPNGSEKAAFSNPYDKRGSRLDYAATVEDAYGDLNKILGGDGIKNLTADTQKLMTQQLQLADAMKSMTPLLEQAKSLIGGFDMKNFGNITEMAKQFKASGSD